MTGELPQRPAAECRYDIVSLGEVMLRLDPGEDRVRTARSFAVREGGGEYNVGRALRRCFGRQVAHITAIGDNEIGRLLEDLMMQGGVSLDHVVWKPTDDVGRANRNPLNFTERGFGVRASRGQYDRAHSAASALRPGDVDWDRLFGELGARWFHTGGIFAGLSSTTLDLTREAMAAARRHGTIVSYDVNYRPSLWAAAGGAKAAEELTAELLDGVDVLFGVDSTEFVETVDRFESIHPRLSVVATPLRVVHSATSNDWTGLAWSRSEGFVEGRAFEKLAVLDRVGGGDAFASGVIHGLIETEPLHVALDLGVAHGALAMTTAGDTSSADLDEIRRVAGGGDASAVR
jgi:2-dehydro-3-deoxygluconokinase